MIRILRCGGSCHRKNEEGMRLMTSSVGAKYVESNDRTYYSEEWDLVFIPSEYIGPENFPNARCIIYGPHNFVFPEGMWLNLNFTDDKRIHYNVLTDWNKTVHSEVGQFEKNMNMAILPFAVDVERFKPSEEKVYERDCFIYIKRRKYDEVEKVKSICDQLKLSYSEIRYGSYNEAELIHLCNTSKFGILLDCHESQGFAVQEMMSMNLPLVVWDATSMFFEGYDQYRGKYELKSTSVTTWDDTCGLVADENTIGDCIGQMMEMYGKFHPRDLIVRELSPRACMEKWLGLINISLNC